MTSFDRRRFLKAVIATTGAGASGVGASGAGASGAGGTALARTVSTDHDHSGDRLGVDEPVASLRADSVTIDDFDLPNTYLVYEDDGTWYGLRTADQTVAFESSDGVEVINQAVQTGAVRVTADDGGTVLESSTTISIGDYYATLIIEDGVTFDYTGSGAAVDVAGAILFSFDTIDANGAAYCLRDIGLGPGYITGTTLRGASDSLWFTDGANREIGAGTVVDIRELDCTAHPTPYGFRATSETAAEGFIVDIGAIRGPSEKGIVLGDRTRARGIKFWLVNAYVDGATNDATRLVEMNDDHNGVWLQGYTPATGGDWDVEVRGSEKFSTFGAVNRRNDLRVLRDAMETANLAQFDTIGQEVLEFDLKPEALESYQLDLAGTGDVILDGGKVSQRTGLETGSWSTVRKQVTHDRVSFDNPTAIKTSVFALDNAGQEAWLVWGDREGPAVGWHIEDDVLEGYVNDGDGASTVSLREAFNPGDMWLLTLFYNPPTQATFYLEEIRTREAVSEDTDSASLSVIVETGTPVPSGLWPYHSDGPDAGDLENPAPVTTNLPSGEAEAGRIMSVDLTNTVPESKGILWSNWKQYQYPRGDLS